MKKNFTYLLLLLVFLGTTAFVVLRYKKGIKNNVNAFYPLQDRKGELAKTAEWTSIQNTAANLIRIIRETPADKKTALALSTIYIQEGRATGNFAYYDKAALHYIDQVLANEPANFEALTLKALVQLSQHHFDEGITTAEKARKINPYNAFVYGLLVDGNVEMGDYKKAVEYSDKMISLRPDIRSYSRVSYLREIHGDYSGAIEAMKMAVEAGGYGDEPTAWARIQLARLYENTGDKKSAEMHYTIALNERPGYAHAIAGLGRIALWNNEHVKAISLFQQADTLMEEPYFKEQLAHAYRASGNTKMADQMVSDVVSQITTSVSATAKDENAAHHADAELAQAYTLLGDFKKALDHATLEYNRRPENIEVNEIMAWIYFKKGEINKAISFLQAALKTNSKNPTLLAHAGIIYAKANDLSRATQFLKAALANNANIDPVLIDESKHTLSMIN